MQCDFAISDSKPTELLIELMDWDSKTAYALYSKFQIGIEAEDYKIKTLGSYNGDARDSFRPHEGVKFSTVDNDKSVLGYCASNGGWWFKNCYSVDLTGKYIKNPTPGTQYNSAIKWYGFHGFNYSLKEARMMIRTI